MSELDIVFTAIIVLLYGAICYLAGKGNLLELISLVIRNEAEKLAKDIKDREEAEKRLEEMRK